MMEKQHPIPPLVKTILSSRGYKTERSMVDFIYSGVSSLSDPFLIPNMKKACATLEKAISKKEKIFVYGDGDADGVCGSFLLLNLLCLVGADFSFRLTHRLDDDYEIEEMLINEIAKEKYSLLISVDCGISSYQALKTAGDNGIKAIVLDHHIGETSKLHPSHIYVNPWMEKEWKNGTENLSGAGIAYKFVEGMGILLPGLKEGKAYEFIELVALSIIADSLPLTGENRIFVKEGLRRMPYTKNKGLAALIESQNLTPPFYLKNISRRLVPRLNSPGRLGNPDIALNLLMEKDGFGINEAVKKVEQMDRERYQMVVKAIKTIKKEALKNGFIASDDISPGICGIIASRLSGQYCKPFMVGYRSDDFLRGSIRAPEGYNLHKKLKPLNKYMLSLGGHKEAMGFKCTTEYIPQVKKIWKDIKWEAEKPNDYYDCILDISDLNPSIIEEIDVNLEPFGKGNPAPVFLCEDVYLKRVSGRGEENNEGILWLKKNGAIYEAVFPSEQDNKPVNGKMNILYTPSVRKQNNLYRIILKIKKFYSF